MHILLFRVEFCTWVGQRLQRFYFVGGCECIEVQGVLYSTYERDEFKNCLALAVTLGNQIKIFVFSVA